ncbi:GlcG/HbpS family heme-binding protein [Caulobacter segnis]|uniref:GlcG/HbpS family heme-binding protein n=1 Tax=Caulobacter segnis TaxID=88688 RepID=UPI001CBAEB7A|nr:heme-binding protein [Caulobacter segnis]UAL12737.1 heme-binding protein [Caulobacter segnis]
MLAILALAAGLATEPLTLPVAVDLARAAIDVCAARGAHVSAAVVDAKGNPLVVLRDEQSPKPPIAAPRKANAAVVFDQPGSVMEPREKTDSDFAARIAADPEHLNPHAGSLPLHVGATLVGGLGVADTGHEAADGCARAALARFPQFH